MKVYAVIECDACQTHEKIVLNEGENVIRSCKCGDIYGDEGGKVIVQSK